MTNSVFENFLNHMEKPLPFEVPEKIHADPEYTEVWPRVLHYPEPSNYDVYGYDENGKQWPYRDYVFSIMDDFGNAVEFDSFNYSQEELRGYMAPDYDSNTPPGQPYKYITYFPFPH